MWIGVRVRPASPRDRVSGLQRKFAQLALLLLPVLGPLFADQAESNDRVLKVEPVLVEIRKPDGAEELGDFEEKRLAGRFTHADSVRWVRGLRPGLDVVWTNAATDVVEFSLTVPNAGDTLRAAVLWQYGVVRGTTAVRVDRRGRSRYRWDLKDDAGESVDAGVYAVHLYCGNASTIFYVVVDGGGLRD